MSSQGINVLRYSALIFGVFYGITHQTAIKASAANKKINQEYDRKSELINQAKAEYQKKNPPQEQQGGVVSDPESPNFDLEAYLNHAAEQSS